MPLPYLHPVVLDYGLNALLTGTTRLSLHAAQPADWDAATTSVLASREYPSLTGPSNIPPAGRKVTVTEITDGWVFADGTAGFWALLDDINHRLIATAALSTPLAVEERNRFTLAAFDIILPGV